MILDIRVINKFFRRIGQIGNNIEQFLGIERLYFAKTQVIGGQNQMALIILMLKMKIFYLKIFA